MPLYEFYCEKCDRIFEALRPIRDSDQPARCDNCGEMADRILPTTFASRAFRGGWSRRVPFHHHSVRTDAPKRTIARVKPKDGAKPAATPKRKKKTEDKS